MKRAFYFVFVLLMLGLTRITSYNVCYTKLLRAAVAAIRNGQRVILSVFSSA